MLVLVHSHMDGGPRDHVFLCVSCDIYLEMCTRGIEKNEFDNNKMTLHNAHYKHCQEFPLKLSHWTFYSKQMK